MTDPKPPADDVSVARICGHLEKGMSLKEACALAGVPYDRLRTWLRPEQDATSSKRAEWHADIERAKAKAIEHWLAYGKVGGNEKNGPMVTMAKTALEGLAPRFRPPKAGADEGRAIHVNILVGATRRGKEIKAEVIHVTPELKEGQG